MCYSPVDNKKWLEEMELVEKYGALYCHFNFQPKVKTSCDECVHGHRYSSYYMTCHEKWKLDYKETYIFMYALLPKNQCIVKDKECDKFKKSEY